MGDLATLERGELAPRGDLLAAFAEFLRLDVANGAASPETVRTYWGQVRAYLAWCEGAGVDPTQAKPADVKAYRAELIALGRRAATVAGKLNAIRRFYAMAQANGYTHSNPAEGLRAPQDRTDASARVKWLPLVAIDRLLKAPDSRTTRGRRDRAILAMMAIHGLRVVEIARLNVASVDLAGQTATILGKGGKKRTVILVDQSAAILREWLHARAQVAAPGEAALFVSLHHPEPGTRISRRNLRRAVDGYLSDLGIKRPGVSCHSLRHSFATLSRASGAKLDAISRALGHSSIAVTQIYADIVDAQAENPAAFLVGALGATGN
jgi:site-specific recombinase XerD